MGILPLLAEAQESIGDAAEVVRAAAQHSWEAAIIALIIIGGMVAFGWLTKQLLQRHLTVEERTLNEAKAREERLASRVSTLEDLIRGELLTLIRQNSETMGKVLSAADSICRASEQMVRTLDRFTSVLDVRPCLLSSAKQQVLLEALQRQDES